MPTSQQRKKLRDALVSAFPERSLLDQLLYFELDKKLNQITKDSNLKVIIFELIIKAESEGWLEYLIGAARKENPGNLQLEAIARELLPSETLPIPLPATLSEQSQQQQRILILAVNPIVTSQLHLDDELSKIEQALGRSRQREQFEIKSGLAVSYRDIHRAILDFKPQIIHFSGHGAGQDGLVFEDETGQVKLVDALALARLFKLFANLVKCVVLNACYSEIQARAIAQHINYVIGMSQAVRDRGAIEFAVGFYDALGTGESIEFAYELGCINIQMARIPEYLTPKLLKKKQLDAEAGYKNNFQPPPIGLRINNLPIQLSSFIGRKLEIEEVKRLLTTTRLLTLTGAAGCGKTRLGLEVAADLLEKYADGVWLVELAALSEPTLIPQTIASVLGVREESRQSLTDRLIEFLNPKSLLLILDNSEHLVTGCAHLVTTLLGFCPTLQILVTSREPLGIAGETIWRVPSLPVANPNQIPPLESLIQFDAVYLFIERATNVKQDFKVTNQNALSIALICYQLDGIPLAIELAAKRINIFSVEEIVRRLHQMFRLLTGGSRTVMPRQQTLCATIDWSYNLLSKPEKTLLRRLSVFAGGWTLEAAETMCIGEEIEDNKVLDLLSRLVDTSLVEVMIGEEGETRYRFLESIRQYSWEKLEEFGETEVLQRRHYEFFLGLAEEVEPKLRGSEQRQWLDLLETEHSNLRTSLKWSQMDTAILDKGLRLAKALGWFWFVRGYLTEGRANFKKLIAISSGASTVLRAHAIHHAGNLAYAQGDYGIARELYQQSLDLKQDIGDKSGIARSIFTLAILDSVQGDYKTAQSRYQESLELRQEIGEKSGIADCFVYLGNLAFYQVDYEKAYSLYEQSLEIYRELEDKSSIAFCLLVLGNVAYEQTDHSKARVFYEESLKLRQESKEKWGIANAYMGLGKVNFAQQDYEIARVFYKKSLKLRWELQDNQGIAFCLEGLADIYRSQNQMIKAAWLYGRTEALRKTINYSLTFCENSRYECSVVAVRFALDEKAFAVAWGQGQAMTIDEIANFALEE